MYCQKKLEIYLKTKEFYVWLSNANKSNTIALNRSDKYVVLSFISGNLHVHKYCRNGDLKNIHPS
jgi:hypothetical protein